MQSNIAKRMREEAVDTEVQSIHGKFGELLFGTPKDEDGDDEDGALFNMLPTFDHLLATLEKTRQKYARNTKFRKFPLILPETN